MVHKTNNIVYDRNIDGDYKVIMQERIANIYIRKQDFYAKDLNTGKEGLILAAILIFGKDKTIISALPHHKTDAIYRVKD